MASYKTVEIDVDLDDFDDGEIIEEMRHRGYQVAKLPDMFPIEMYWNQDNKKEALILLEREFPELRGISSLVN
jgi:hypothetical protein